MDRKPLYPYSFHEAKRNDELPLYQESFSENRRCAYFIKKTIEDNFDGMHLGGDVAKVAIAEFGYDRVNFVLANTLKELSHDGRFSRQNKEWAASIYIPENKIDGTNLNAQLVVGSHPAVLDGFIKLARQEYAGLNLWQPVQCNDKTHLDYTGKIMVLNPSHLKDEYKTPRDQLVLCESGFGCSPSASGRKVYGRFLSDGEKCEHNRSDFMGELKAEFVPDWAMEAMANYTENAQKMEKGENISPTMGGIEMQ